MRGGQHDQATAEAVGAGGVMAGGGQHDQVWVVGGVHVHVDGGERDQVQVVGEVDIHVRRGSMTKPLQRQWYLEE